MSKSGVKGTGGVGFQFFFAQIGNSRFNVFYTHKLIHLTNFFLEGHAAEKIVNSFLNRGIGVFVEWFFIGCFQVYGHGE